MGYSVLPVVRSDNLSESRQSSSQFWAGVFSGALCTLIGFGLTVLWDNHKYWRDLGQRDAAVTEVLRQEVRDNLDLANQDEKTIADEFAAIKESRTLVQPLSLL